MESEFISLKLIGSEAEWLRNFLVNIPLGIKPTPSVSIHCNSQSALAITKNTSYNGKIRHVQLRNKCSKPIEKIWNYIYRLCEFRSDSS